MLKDQVCKDITVDLHAAVIQPLYAVGLLYTWKPLNLHKETRVLSAVHVTLV